MDKVRLLLERGYFPSQLPPGFTTSKFARVHKAIGKKWVALSSKADSCKGELFSVARAGHSRRTITLPNPVSQYYLAAEISKYWKEIKSHYKKSLLNLNRPTFRKSSERSIKTVSMHELHERKLLAAAGYKYLLKTDISRFFPTIYTHSIPWSAHGKSVAKKNRSNPAYYGNSLDLHCRQGQDQQTIGIPIGPDTSHIVAEIVATAVDVAIRNELGHWPEGFRYVDDYFLFFDSQSEAEAALAAISKAAKEYELDLNFDKTRIVPIYQISEEYWTHQLRSFDVASSGGKQRSDIHHYFELAFDLARENSDENVMKYALRRISSVIIRKENWDMFEAHLCRVALAHSNTLQTIAHILCTYNHYGYPLRKDRLARLLNSMIVDKAPLNHHSEVVWGLWICKELGLDLRRKTVDALARTRSSACAILTLHLEKLGQTRKPVSKSYWKQFLNANGLYDELWLLVYEGGVRRWVTIVTGFISSDKYFGELSRRNIRFYDEGAKLPLLFVIKQDAKDRLKLRNVLDLFDSDVEISEHVEFEDGDSDYSDLPREEE